MLKIEASHNRWSNMDNTVVNEIEISEKAKHCLQVAGWSPGRQIDTDPFEALNRECGFYVCDSAIEFLREFGGLTLRFPHFRDPENEDWCHFHAASAAGHAIPQAIEEYETVVGERLTVIGEARSNHFTLCMSGRGCVFGGFEDVLVKFGDTGREAINTVCEGRETTRIPVPEIPDSLAHRKRISQSKRKRTIRLSKREPRCIRILPQRPKQILRTSRRGGIEN